MFRPTIDISVVSYDQNAIDFTASYPLFEDIAERDLLETELMRPVGVTKVLLGGLSGHQVLVFCDPMLSHLPGGNRANIIEHTLSLIGPVVTDNTSNLSRSMLDDLQLRLNTPNRGRPMQHNLEQRVNARNQP